MSSRLVRTAVCAAIGGIIASGVGIAPASAAVVGICTIKANDPHPSGHVSGNINAQGTVACSQIMDQIKTQTTLEKSNGQVWSAGVSDKKGVQNLSTYGNTSCSNSPGTFRTRLEVTLQFPAGFTPRYHYNNYYSPWKSFACGAARAASDSTQEAAEFMVVARTDGSLTVTSA
jgi:hypothetical protein